MNPIFQRLYILCLSIAITISTSLSAIKLSKNTSDEEIAYFYSSKERYNVRFIYFFEICDRLLFTNVYISKIRELRKRIKKDNKQLNLQENKIGIDGLKKIINFNRLYLFGHVFERFKYLLSRCGGFRPKDSEIDSPVYFADKNNLAWWYGKGRNNGFAVIEKDKDKDKDNDSEIISFDFWINYAPIPDNWLKTVEQALIKIGYKKAAVREFKTKLYPLQQRKQQLLLDFTRANADNLNAVMAHKRGQLTFINDEEKIAFFHNFFGFFKQFHSINNQFNAQLIDNNSLKQYLKDLGINMPTVFIELTVTLIQL